MEINFFNSILEAKMLKRLASIVFVLLITIVLTQSWNTGKEFLPAIEDEPGLHHVQSTESLPHKQHEKSEDFSQRKQRIKGLEKKDNPSFYNEFHRGIRTRDGRPGPDYKHNYQVRELLKARSVGSTRDLAKMAPRDPLPWIERGPGNVSGRTRGIVVDPDDTSLNTWFAGSVSGGVWKTTNAGHSWTHITEGFPNLATSTIAMAASNHDIIYVGTGEGFGNIDQIDGSGIWKSLDRGVTWNQLASTADNAEFQNIQRMIIDPANPDIVLVATAPGFHYLSGTSPASFIFKTENGGLTWTKNYTSDNGDIQQILADPSDFNIQYATINRGGVIKSTDAGVTWNDASQGLRSFVRLEMAISPSDPNTLYISAEDESVGATLFISEDAGATWRAAREFGANDINWLGGQGWYDNTIAVNPYDKYEVFVGGINLFRINVQEGQDLSDETIIDVNFDNTESFLTFRAWNGDFLRTGIGIGYAFHDLQTMVVQEEYTTVEIRFGPGKSQRAHRFTWAQNYQYPYQDYVDVPFEVWDTVNNQQLMASFRDHDQNGAWNPKDDASASGGQSREYIFIHTIPYDASTPDVNIAATAGQAYKNTYAIWPESPAGVTFDASALPNATIRITWGQLEVKRIATTVITDGYGQFGGQPKGVHVDQHNILLIPTDPSTMSYRLVNGNDGGVSYSDDKGETFVQPTNGYNTTQFYGVDKKNGEDRYIGGTQDNGSWFSPVNPDALSDWNAAPSGDGFQCLYHYKQTYKVLETSQFNSIYRSSNNGGSWDWVSGTSGLGDVGPGNSPFFTKIAKCRQDPDLVFAVGKSGVWRSDDFCDSFVLIPMPDGWVGTSSYTNVKVSIANPQIVWAGRNMVDDTPLFVSTNNGVSFERTTVYDEVSLGRITGLTTHPTDQNTAYALFSFAGAPKILRTTDLGASWTDISGFGTNPVSNNGFPDVAVYSLLVMPWDTDIIWAGTEIGLFESTNGGGTWAYADNGFPAVGVWEMVIVNDEIVIGTHGRGIWTVSMPQLDGYEPPDAVLSPRIINVTGGLNGILRVTYKLPMTYDSTFVSIDGLPHTKVTGSASTGALHAVVDAENARTVAVSLISYKNGVPYICPARQVLVYTFGVAAQSYGTTFDVATNDFINQGLEVTTATGFPNSALHSPHNYPQNTELTSVLRIPIIVSSTNPIMRYDDIAIIEKGAAGTAFGDDSFWDYVVVEGSNDLGNTWTPLLDGYDADFDQAWSAVYDINGTPDPSMFVSHEIDLSQAFNPGESIIIRFRLFSDPNTVGWGWIVDNVDIQGGLTSIADSDAMPKAFNLSQNYPNPFNPETQIIYALPKSVPVTLAVYNMRGQRIWTFESTGPQAAGFHTITWNGRDDQGLQQASGVYFYRLVAGDFQKVRKMTLIK